VSEQLFNGTSAHYGLFVDMKSWLKGKGRPYSINYRAWGSGADPGSWQSACRCVSHKPGGRLPLLSAKPAVTPVTLKRAATNFAAW